MNNEVRYDFERRERIGFIEAIWGEDKNIEQLKKVAQNVLEKNEVVFITRINIEKSNALLEIYPYAKAYTDARCLIIGQNKYKFMTKRRVAIISGGTSDSNVVLEAKLALKIHNVQSETFIDVGVAGIHRLFNVIDEINQFDILIVVAGMEGALPTVIGGLFPQPIIAVPASVGYGVSKEGRAALNSMLSSCSPGITVMNIDNGYGAAMAALRILRSFKS